MLRLMADLGNSRLKWGKLGPDGRLADSRALAVGDPSAWSAAWEAWGLSDGAGTSWAVASVNPPLAERLERFLDERGVQNIRWFRSAAHVPVRHELEHPASTGADRALAVLEAAATHREGTPGLVVSCGSAITVERIDARGVWLGGAIAPGLGLSARALHDLTAQLPLVAPRETPPAWGRSTRPAIEAGLFWGAVGAVRELISRQSADLASAPWVVWTGGDAALLAPRVEPDGPEVVPDLVLQGIARVLRGGLDEPDGSS